MDYIVKPFQLWVGYDSDNYVAIIDVGMKGKVYYRHNSQVNVHSRSHDDFIMEFVNVDDVVGEYAHKNRNHVRINVSICHDGDISYLVRSDAKEFKLDIGGLYEHWDKI